MVKVTITYPNKPGSHFDAEYYVKVHMPMVVRLLGNAVATMTAEIGLSSQDPDEAPAYAAIAGFMCESAEVFAQALVPVAAQLEADIPNYTDIEPVFQVSRVYEFAAKSA